MSRSAIGPAPTATGSRACPLTDQPGAHRAARLASRYQGKGTATRGPGRCKRLGRVGRVKDQLNPPMRGACLVPGPGEQSLADRQRPDHVVGDHAARVVTAGPVAAEEERCRASGESACQASAKSCPHVWRIHPLYLDRCPGRA